MRELPADLLHAEIESSTAALASLVRGTDPGLPIPACPQWSLRQLATHVGRAHRWAAEIVATRSADFIEFGSVPDGKAPAGQDDRADWLAAGAGRLVAALRAAGEDRVWAFGQLSPARFWARRMAHETLVHRADAQAAAGQRTEIAASLAADAIDEWLTVMSGPLPGAQPDLRAQALPTGTSLRVHATDQEFGGAACWLVSHGQDGVQVLPADAAPAGAAADVTVSGTAAGLLLMLMRRVSPADGGVAVGGDAALLDRWLERTAF